MFTKRAVCSLEAHAQAWLDNARFIFQIRACDCDCAYAGYEENTQDGYRFDFHLLTLRLELTE